MPTLNIKTRILLFVVVFEILAYSSIVLFNNYFYTTELTKIKQKEIFQTFNSSVEAIDNSISIMENNAFNLAQHGKTLYELQKIANFERKTLKNQFAKKLTEHFKYFKQALGGGLWFEPNVLLKNERYFGPYVYRDNQDVIFSWELSLPAYDYHNQSWYKLGINAHKDNKNIIWTEPYIDEAGSYSPMMTVDALIYSNEKELLGMSTVDWSLFELTKLLNEVKITENASPFLIHKSSQKIISFPLKPEFTMSNASDLEWAKRVMLNSSSNNLEVLRNIKISNIQYDMYFIETKSGFIFGSFSPQSDFEKDITKVTVVTMLGGAIIGTLFIFIMFILMKYLFTPFDLVLNLIKGSISHTKSNKVSVETISYDKENEFTPIIEELNLVYDQVNGYIKAINLSNQALIESKSEIKSLNEELEVKVQHRTEALNIKTQEAVQALIDLKSAQSQLIEQEKHASLGRLVAGIAHEVNTPLGISITSSSCLEGEVKSVLKKIDDNSLNKTDFLKSFSIIEECCYILKGNLQRTSELISSFKQVSVDQSSEQSREIEINEYIKDVIRTLTPKLNKSKHQVNFEPTVEPIYVLCKPGAIAQVLTNIIENAIIHAYDGLQQGVLTINISQQDSQVLILVADDGKGMEESILKCIFDPFFTTNRHGGGSGLGMHLVYNIVTQQLGGSITCSSIINKGTQFIIKFPLRCT